MKLIYKTFIFFQILSNSCTPQTTQSKQSSEKEAAIDQAEITDSKKKVEVGITSGEAKGTQVTVAPGTLSVGSTLNVAATVVPAEVAKRKLTVASPSIEVEVKDKSGNNVTEVKTPLTIAIPYNSGSTLALAGVDSIVENLCAILKSSNSMFVWRYVDLIVDKSKNLVSLKSKMLGVFTLAYCGQQKLDGIKEAASTGVTGTSPTATNEVKETTSNSGSTTTTTTTTNPPYIVSIAHSGSRMYGLGDTISVEATFNEAVNVSGGIPYLEIFVENLSKNLNYVSGSGTSKLMFRSDVITKGWNDFNGTHLTGALMETRYVKNLNGLTAVSSFHPEAYVGLKVSTPWLKQLGATTKQPNLANANTGGDYCFAVTTDIYGNVYCAGASSGNIGSGNAGGQDLFIAKFNMHGALSWVYQHGNHLQQGCKAITSDSEGNIYCAGNTEGNLQDQYTTNDNTNDGFILKLNSSGAPVWLKQFGLSAKNSQCLSVAVDASYVYCGGVENGATQFTGYPWLIKVNKSDGTLIWSKNFTNGLGFCYGVTVDSSGNVYCGGSTSGEFGSESNAGGDDVLIAKVDANNTTSIVKQFGNPTTAVSNLTNANFGNDACFSIQWASSGHLYCGGSTTGAFAEAHGGGQDLFVLKMSSSNLSVVSAKQLGATSKGSDASGNDSCNSLAIRQVSNSSEEVYCGGYTNGNLGETNSVVNTNDALVVKFATDGSLSWVRQMGNTTLPNLNGTMEICNGIAFDYEANIFCGGYTDGSLTEAFAGTHDTFMLKLDREGNFN